MDMAVEARAPEGQVRRGWFGREEAPAGVELILECELGYTFDPAVWGQGYANEAAQGVRDYARDGLVPPVIDSAVDFRIDGSAMTEMHRDRETDCREEVCGEAQR